jgi:hypothetical protein
VNATLRKLSEYENSERDVEEIAGTRWLTQNLKVSHQDCKAGGIETVNLSSAQSYTALAENPAKIRPASDSCQPKD